MIPLSQPTKIGEHTPHRGVFVIEGLYPGYGITLGNSLRRVLLSSLEGAAVTKARVKGVGHEFSTLPGVREDVLTILLNLKQMRFRLHEDLPQNAILKVKGEREVKASDFKIPPTLELANGDLVIAHLTEKSAGLEIEIEVEKGIGYVPVEERRQERQEIGVMALDAIFTPITRVRTQVENMRVGERTDFNRLIVEVQTDGTLTPAEAFFQATDILLKQFTILMEGVKEAATKQHALQVAEEKRSKRKGKQRDKSVKERAKRRKPKEKKPTK